MSFDPDQPRAPAGSPNGGQWVAVGQGAGRYNIHLGNKKGPDVGTVWKSKYLGTTVWRRSGDPDKRLHRSRDEAVAELLRGLTKPGG